MTQTEIDALKLEIEKLDVLITAKQAEIQEYKSDGCNVQLTVHENDFKDKLSLDELKQLVKLWEVQEELRKTIRVLEDELAVLINQKQEKIEQIRTLASVIIGFKL